MLRRLTDAEIEQVIQRCGAGDSIDKLSHRYAVHHNSSNWTAGMTEGWVSLNRGRYTEAAARYGSLFAEGGQLSGLGVTSFSYHARAGLVIPLALAGSLGEALRELHIHEDKLVASQRDDKRTARLIGLAAINYMLGRTQRSREPLAIARCAAVLRICRHSVPPQPTHRYRGDNRR